MCNIFILFFLIYSIICESENWWSEITKHDYTTDDGYSGNPPKIANDFYLCSERKYRLHFVGDDKNTWSEEYTACEPAGINRGIDGLAISGGLPYQVYNDGWSGEVEGYNTTDPNGWLPYSQEFNREKGFASRVGMPLMAFIVHGDEIYRCSDTHRPQYLASNEKLVAQRVIYNLFEINCTFNNYDNEIKIDTPGDKKINVTVILLKRDKINFEGKLRIKIEKEKIIKTNYGISESYNNFLNDLLDFDIKNFSEKFENLMMTKGLSHGDIIINFNWLQNLIEINVAVKIKFDFYGYRGGVRIKIYLNDNDFELLSKVKQICKAFIRYSGKRTPKNLKNILSNLNSFKKIQEVIKFLDVYSVPAEEAIFFTVLSKITKF